MLFSEMPAYQLKAILDGEIPNPEWKPESIELATKRLTKKTKRNRKQDRKRKAKLAETGRKLWRELFLEIESEADLLAWEERIPSFGCSCRPFYQQWKRSHPPAFPLSFDWKYLLKSAVNQKLGHPNLTFQEAGNFWESQQLSDG